jgi:hypothetical protein
MFWKANWITTYRKRDGAALLLRDLQPVLRRPLLKLSVRGKGYHGLEYWL